MYILLKFSANIDPALAECVLFAGHSRVTCYTCRYVVGMSVVQI